MENIDVDVCVCIFVCEENEKIQKRSDSKWSETKQQQQQKMEYDSNMYVCLWELNSTSLIKPLQNFSMSWTGWTVQWWPN